MHHASELLLSIFLIYTAAIFFAELAQRIRVPAVVGEIAAGCVIGPSVLGWVEITPSIEALSEIGVMLLLFSVGLETGLSELRKVGRKAVVVGASGVLLPFMVGGLWAYWSGYTTAKAAFVGAAFVATSAGITARVLQELNVLDRRESKIILAAAVIDDILAMLVLGVVSSFQEGIGVNVLELTLTLLEALIFIIFSALLGSRFMRRFSPVLERPIDPLSPLTISLAGCIGLSVIASHVGLAAIIGAFLAGTIMAEAEQQDRLEHQLKPIVAFLVPFFFVSTGAKVEFSALASSQGVIAVIVVTALAFLSKFIGCSVPALALGKRSAAIIGVGMAPRGEVGIVVATLGQQAGIFNNMTYSVIIAMSLLTSIISPFLLRRLYRDHPKD